MLALDVLLLLLIGVCIVYCWMLNQRIRDLHNSRVEFARMIKEFDLAVIKAEGCISELSVLGANASDYVKNLINDSEATTADLKTLNEFGIKLAERLETGMAACRKMAREIEAIKPAEKSLGSAAPTRITEANIAEYIANAEKQVAEQQATANEPIEEEYVAAEVGRSLLETVMAKIALKSPAGPTMFQDAYYDSLRRIVKK